MKIWYIFDKFLWVFIVKIDYFWDDFLKNRRSKELCFNLKVIDINVEEYVRNFIKIFRVEIISFVLLNGVKLCLRCK